MLGHPDHDRRQLGDLTPGRLGRIDTIRLGELDIVARREGCLVFVEVKARRAPAYVDPALGVDWRKQRQLRRVAEAYLALEKPVFAECRFDVMGVVVGPSGVEVTRLEAAF